MKEYPFNSTYSHIKTFYGLELDSDEFETIGLAAWDKINNKRVRKYLYQNKPVKISNSSWYLDLPCNADYIEAVTAGYEDYDKTSSVDISGGGLKFSTENYIEKYKYNTSSLYVPGKFIKFDQEDNRLYFRDKYDIVNVLYMGYIVDDEGLPSLNSAEMDAVAAYCAYVTYFKKALVNRDSGLAQFAQVLKQEWLKKCTQARIPERISQNDMDEILNASTSWDRKRYGKSFKPVR